MRPYSQHFDESQLGEKCDLGKEVLACVSADCVPSYSSEQTSADISTQHAAKQECDRLSCMTKANEDIA